jgi:tetratricopeptide (TPR) repeat protein
MSIFAQTNDPAYLKAQMLEAQGKLEEARVLYESLNSAHPTDLFFWKLVGIYERTGDYRAMERISLEKLKAVPGDLAAVNYLSRAYHGLGEEARSRKVLFDNIGDRWDDQERVMNAAGEFQSRNDMGSAIEVYLLARGKTGNPKLYALDLARLYTVQMNYPKALEEYLKVLEENPYALVSVEMMLKTPSSGAADPDDMAALLVSYLKSRPKSVKVARLLFLVRAKAGDVDGGVRAVLDASVAAGNASELKALAERMESEGRPREALLLYDALWGKFPSDAGRSAVLLKSAAIRIALGDSEGAKKNFQTVIDGYSGKPEASLAALRLMEIAGKESDIDLTGKLKAFAESATDNTVAYQAYLLLTDSFLRKGDTKGASDAVAHALLKAGAGRERFDASAKAAMIRLYACEFDEMTRDIETSVSFAPDGREAHDLLALRLLVLRASSAADRKLLASYARGRFDLFRGKEREGLDSLAAASSDTASAVAPEAARALGEWWRAKGDAGKALEWYTRAVSTARDTTAHVSAMMDAADLYIDVLGDRESAKRLYVDALTAFPGTVFDSELRSRLRGVTEKK